MISYHICINKAIYLNKNINNKNVFCYINTKKSVKRFMSLQNKIGNECGVFYLG